MGFLRSNAAAFQHNTVSADPEELKNFLKKKRVLRVNAMARISIQRLLEAITFAFIIFLAAR